MVWLGSWIVRMRVVIVVTTLLVMGGAVALMPRVRIDGSSRNLLFSAPEVRQAFLRYAQRWGSDRLLVVALEAPGEQGIFSAAVLRHLQLLGARLDSLSVVERSESLTSTSLLFARGETLEVQPMVPRQLPAGRAALSRLRARALASPLLRRLLLDDQGRMAAINLRMRYDETDPEVLLGGVRTVRKTLGQLPPPAGCKVRLVGGPVLLEYADGLIRRDVVVLTLAPVGLVGLFLIFFFRSLRGVLLPLAVVAGTSLATFGALVLSGHAINLVTSMLPALVMVIGVADAVHVLVAHQEAARRWPGDRQRAAVGAVESVGLPCMLTTVTTAVGFGSLALSDISQVREFGMFAALGVVLALIFAVVSLPAMLAMLPLPAARPGGARGPGLGARLARLQHHYGRLHLPVLVGAALLGVLGVWGLTRLRVESSVVTYLPSDHPVHADLAAVERRLTGTVPVVIHLWDRRRQVAAVGTGARARRVQPPDAGAVDTGGPVEGGAGGEQEVLSLDDPEDDVPDVAPAGKTTQRRREKLRDPAVLAAVDRLTATVSQVPGVRKVVAITEYLKEVNRVMRGGAARHFRLPSDRKLIATYLELVSVQDADALENLISTNRAAANVTILTRAHGSAQIRRILDAIEAVLARPEVRSRLGADVAVEVTGLGPLMASVADRIVIGQLKSCFVALGVICLMFVLVFWSVRTALMALVPNVLPILFTVGLMGWIGVSLNVTTVMIASIALGIAVDDTIHMLIRSRRETWRHGDHAAALGRALASSGQAIVITTFVVGGGFLVLLLASLTPPRRFGLFTALTMFVALAAALLLLPVLVLWLKPWRKRG